MSSEPPSEPPSELPSESPRGEGAWLKLHPASVLANLLPVTGRLLRGLGMSLLPFLVLSRKSENVVRLLGSAAVFFCLALAVSTLRTLSTRYRFSGGQLEIRRGFVFRRARIIDPARVQNTEVVQTFSHKLLGLVELKLETASGMEAEGQLSALSPERAQELIAALHSGRAGQAPAASAPPEETLLIANGPADLVRYGATATGLGVGAVLVGALLDSADVFQVLLGGLSRRWEAWAGPGLLWLGAVLALGVVAAVLWLGNATVAMVRYHGFRLVRSGERFRASFGLLTRRQVGLSLDRIQLVTVDEPLPRRWLRFGSVEVETAGLRQGQGGVEHAEVVVPVVPASGMTELVRHLVPELPAELAGLPLRPPHPRALWRARVRTVALGVLLALPLTFFFWPWGVLAWALLPLELWRVWLDFRCQGWLVTEHLILVRRGAWRRRTQVLRRARLQSLRARQGPLERRHGLGHVQVSVAGSHVSFPSTSWEETLALVDALPLSAPAAAAPSLPRPDQSTG